MSEIFRFYGQVVTENGDLWVTEIRKPIYGTCVALNERLLNEAIRKGKKILVKCPGAEETIDPQEWKKTAMRIEKVFRFPDRPMILYQKLIGSPQGQEDGDVKTS